MNKSPMKPLRLGELVRRIRPVLRRLASIKAGSVLLAGFFLFTLVAAFSPPVKDASGVLQDLALAVERFSDLRFMSFQERFESTGFVLALSVLILMLCLSLYFRVRSELNRSRGRGTPPSAHASGTAEGVVASSHVAAVERELQRRGYRTAVAHEAGIAKVQGTQGRAGVWGSFLFHASILMILAGVALSTLMSFEASIALTEGQAFDQRTDRFGVQKADSWYVPPSAPLRFRLIRVVPDYEVNGATTTASIVEATPDAASARFPVHINRGLRLAGRPLHQGWQTGYSPQVVVETADGTRLIEGYVRLAALARSKNTRHQDFVKIPGRNMRVEFELWPDAVYRDGVYRSKSTALRNPVLHVQIYENDKLALDQFLTLGETATTDGLTARFPDVRRWSQLDVADDPGPVVLMAGSLLASIGLALRLLCVRRRIVVSLRQVNQVVAFDLNGSTEKFQHAFKEELASVRCALSRHFEAGVRPAATSVTAAPGAPALARTV